MLGGYQRSGSGLEELVIIQLVSVQNSGAVERM